MVTLTIHKKDHYLVSECTLEVVETSVTKNSGHKEIVTGTSQQRLVVMKIDRYTDYWLQGLVS